ncbi:MAG: hypothetical protein ACR2K1_08760 [Saprospiraceae bacterium]
MVSIHWVALWALFSIAILSGMVLGAVMAGNSLRRTKRTPQRGEGCGVQVPGVGRKPPSTGRD